MTTLEFLLQGVLTGGLVYGVSILNGLKASIDHLNKQVARIVEKATWHEQFLQKNDLRITQLEIEFRKLLGKLNHHN